MRRAAWLGWLGVIATLSSCGGSPPPPATQAPTPAGGAGAPPVATQPAPPKPPAAPAQAQPGEAARAAAGSVLTPPPPRYDAKGRRDPFENVAAKEKERERAGGFSIASARLTGIVQGRTTLALIETPEGFGYILKPGDTIGDGRLIEIGRDTAVFAVTKPGSTSNRVVLKIATD